MEQVAFMDAAPQVLQMDEPAVTVGAKARVIETAQLGAKGRVTELLFDWLGLFAH